MPWIEVFAALVVCHLVGDFLIQTEFQAKHKPGGLGRNPLARRALASHAASYLACHVPAVAWVAAEAGLTAAEGIAAAAAIVVPHAIQDDGRVTRFWMRHVKRTEYQPGVLALAVDQSFHVVALFALALVLGS